jgi:hypothetical protein
MRPAVWRQWSTSRDVGLSSVETQTETSLIKHRRTHGVESVNPILNFTSPPTHAFHEYGGIHKQVDVNTDAMPPANGHRRATSWTHLLDRDEPAQGGQRVG